MSDQPTFKDKRGMTENLDLKEPILPGKGATDYERYLQLDDLLALQKTDKLRHPDEMTFIVIHQSSELLLKGIGFDLERVRQAMAASDLANASRLLRRINRMIEYPIDMLHALETLTPYDYHIIRAGLGHGSGLDSPGFLGILHIGPKLNLVLQEQLAKQKLTPEEMYRRHSEPEVFAMHQLAEDLLDFDEHMQIFRYHHFKLACRIIGGGVLGTTGNPVDILKQRQEHSFFKDLWEARNLITAKVNAARDTEAGGHGEKDKPGY